MDILPHSATFPPGPATPGTSVAPKAPDIGPDRIPCWNHLSAASVFILTMVLMLLLMWPLVSSTEAASYNNPRIVPAAPDVARPQRPALCVPGDLCEKMCSCLRVGGSACSARDGLPVFCVHFKLLSSPFKLQSVSP